MHDLDRTQLEGNWEATMNGNGEFGNGYQGEANMYGETFDDEFAFEDEFGMSGEFGGEFEDEYDGFEFEDEDEFEFEYGDGEVYGGVLDEADEMELAAEMLEITSQDELDQFLGKVFRRVTRKVGRVIPRQFRRPLGGMLRKLGRRFLPIGGAALGNLIAPGIGGVIGGSLASQAGRLFGLELEGLSPEDQEFEVARHYVRLASESARQAAMTPANTPPAAAAQRAVAIAAQRHAPGLVQRQRAQTGGGRRRRRQRRGMWVRRGNAIVLLNVYR